MEIRARRLKDGACDSESQPAIKFLSFSAIAIVIFATLTFTLLR